MASIALEHIRKRFKNKSGYVEALVDLDLKVHEKELLVLVGPSGCGKTTALRIIAGLDMADAGHIRMGGSDVGGVSPKDRDVAMVFQNYALYPHMSVYKNLAFGLKMRRRPKDEIKKRVQEIAEMLHIEHLLDRRPSMLSGGEQQRVAVGRAIVRRPKVFLLDEPLANLDVRLRLDMRTEIKRLQRALGISMVYVTHDQEEAMALGDRVAIMNQGRLIQCDTPQQVYDFPANRFVAGFIGSPPMNLVSGRLMCDDSEYFFSSSEGNLKLIHHDVYTAHVNQDIIVGIRPHHVLMSSEKVKGADLPLDAASIVTLGQFSVVAVEPMGYATTIHMCSHEGTKMVASIVHDDGLTVGDRVILRVDLARIHLFIASENGRRLL